MSKVHITLVGGQAMPVYLGIKYAQPDKVIAICSKESRHQIDGIKTALKESQQPEVEIESLILDPSDMVSINASVSNCLSAFAEDEVSINISSGTKAWAYFFAKIFESHPNTVIFYIDQNSIVWDVSNGVSTQFQIDTKVQFILSGFPIPSHKNIETYTEQDYAVIEQIRRLRDSDLILSEFNAVTKEMELHPNLTETSTMSGASLIWKQAEHLFTLNISNGTSYTFSSPNVHHLVLKAGWFEVKVAKMLSEWERCTEVWTNCVFTTENVTSNEVDIIANLGNKLLIVECKTQIFNNTDIDKFNSVVKKYGGNASKALFVTYEAMSQANRATCEKYGITPFSFKNRHYGKVKEPSSLITEIDKSIRKPNT